MSRPLVSVVIPTIGRLTLERTLKSIRWQARVREVELVVVGDTHGDDFAGDLASVPALCQSYDARYLSHDGSLHQVGQPQRNYGMQRALGTWLMFSQDDAIWTRDAWAQIRPALAGAKGPRLFRVATRFGFTVWEQHQSLQPGYIDADCICTPNLPDRLGVWTPRYEGDSDFIRHTVELWRGRVLWERALIAYARPDARQDWVWQVEQGVLANA